MAEDNARVPWFSGLCLEGEVAGQYEIEGVDNQQEPTGTGTASQLELDGLAPITIFVGANNSGKSRLMRELFQTQQPTKIKLKSRYRDAEGKSEEEDIGPKLQNWIDIITKHQHNKGIENDWILESERGRIEDIIKTLDDKIAAAVGNRNRTTQLQTVKKNLSSCGIDDGIRGFQEAKRSYIPILRGMRPLLNAHSQSEANKCTDDPYKQRTLVDYFSDRKSMRGFCDDNDSRHSIFTGLALFENLRRRLLAPTQTERETVRMYECFLSEHFFPDQPVTLVPAEYSKDNINNDVVHIKIGNNDDYPIYKVGDGMQSLIICTYPIITETEPGSLFFLEEPDLCMHPSLQRTFLEVLKTYHSKMGHQFFLTTHSNHLLDLLEDNELVSIFSFSEIGNREPVPDNRSQTMGSSGSASSKPTQHFRVRSSALRDRLTLMQLGVRPSATYLANATIWVEGVSDCTYLRAYMKAFVHYLKARGNAWGESLAHHLNRYKEDRHYAFVEYGGANLTHLSFQDQEDEQDSDQTDKVTSVPHLCARAIVVADGDITGRNKGNRWVRYAKQLGQRLIILPCKEIENLIPEALMRIQVERDCESIDPKELAKIKYDKYRNMTGIGTYLSRLGFSRFTYSDKSGTLTRYRKDSWASNQKGIPLLLRQEIEKDKVVETHKDALNNPTTLDNSSANHGAHANKCLPSYMTNDLIWLCTCIYAHIAKFNHDDECHNKLRKFQEFIMDQGKRPEGHQKDANVNSPPVAETSEPDGFAASEWPIKDANNQCLMTNFLP